MLIIGKVGLVSMADMLQISTPEADSKNTKKASMKGKRKWIVLATIVVLLLVGFMFMRRQAARQISQEVTYQEVAVERQNITNSLTGSGTLQPANSYTVTTLVSGEILSDHFEEGDVVMEDQLLYTIDSSDASTSTSQAQENYEDALKSKYPTADMSGLISEVYVQDGDSVSAGTQLCKIMDTSTISVDFQFSYADKGAFYVGQSAKVYVSGFEEHIIGTVQQIGSSGIVNDTGRKMTFVRVTFENPGFVTESSTAQAVIGTYTSYGQTSLKVGTSSIVTASVSGKISGMKYLPGDSISSGAQVCIITGDSVDKQISNALTNLENAQDRLDDYQVTSPIAGTVIEKYAKAGDNAGVSGNSSSTLCIIYDLSYLEMTLNIDELDISTVAVGQEVQITADAVPDRLYNGVVTKISVVGSTSGGTTTYPVTVRLDETTGLLPGMNVDAEIFLSGAENVLAVPNSAVNRGNTVLITKDSPSAVNALEQEAPEGYVYVAVTTGESDDSYIEITSGLQEGDTVAYLRISSGNGMMMPGMMPGGRPGGMSGMPSGGMPGGRPGGGGMPSGGRPSGGMPSGGGFPG